MIASILQVPRRAMLQTTQTAHELLLLPSDLIWKQLTENVRFFSHLKKEGW